MHYVNVARGSTKFNMAGCGQSCVILAIRNYTSMFISVCFFILILSFFFQKGLLTEQRYNLEQCQYGKGIEPCPLIFLTHFMGDIHQPLHVSYDDDR